MRNIRVWGGILTILVIAASLWHFASRIKTLQTRSERNILFVLCDALRADHLGTYGYERDTTPNIDRFSKDATVFTNAISAAPWTPPSVASMFTGLLPTSHRVLPPNDRLMAEKRRIALSPKAITFAEILKQAGYATFGITSNPWVSKPFGLDQGFDHFQVLSRGTAEEINKGAFAYLEARKKNDPPFLLYLHYLDVHRGGIQRMKLPPIYSGKLMHASYDTEMLNEIAQYDTKLRYFDEHFGALIEYLKSKRLYDTTDIIFVSDHGEQFMERGSRGHGYNFFDEELRVPLIIKSRNTPSRIEDTVTSRDIYATVLDLAGLPKPEKRTGISLFNPEKRSSRPGIVSEANRNFDQASFTNLEGKKLILKFPSDPDHPKPFDLGAIVQRTVFDRKSDPGESKPLSDSKIEETLQTAFATRYERAIEQSLMPDRGGMNKETVEQLKSLGYLK